MLRNLHEGRLRIGGRLEVVDRQPFDGPLTVRVEGGDRIPGRALAATTRVGLDG
jgi:hypothetical protein